MLYLIAGNERQAEFWVHHNHLNAKGKDRTVTIVRDENTLRGIRLHEEDTVIWYGSMRSDYELLRDIVRHITVRR